MSSLPYIPRKTVAGRALTKARKDFTIKETWLKAPTSAFTFKT